MNKGFLRFLAYIFAAIVVCIVYIALALNMGDSSLLRYMISSYSLSLLPAVPVTATLLFVMSFGFRALAKGLSYSFGAALLIIPPLLAPLAVAILQKVEIASTMPLHWWLIPLVTACAMLLLAQTIANWQLRQEREKPKRG